MKRIFIRVRDDDFTPGAWMITAQTEGFPESVGFLDDDLSGLHGSKSEMFALAEKLRVEYQASNPDMDVVVVK